MKFLSYLTSKLLAKIIVGTQNGWRAFVSRTPFGRWLDSSWKKSRCVPGTLIDRNLMILRVHNCEDCPRHGKTLDTFFPAEWLTSLIQLLAQSQLVFNRLHEEGNLAEEDARDVDRMVALLGINAHQVNHTLMDARIALNDVRRSLGMEVDPEDEQMEIDHAFFSVISGEDWADHDEETPDE